MAISSEFAQAVRDKNILRVKIMLKDSLLVDKTFYLFDEMQAYASAQGASPWTDEDVPLEKAEKPWSEDTMNYELTALVNDFTKKHVNYVKAIISDVYKTDIPVPQRQSVPQPTRTATSYTANRVNTVGGILGAAYPHKTILSEVSSINRILKNNKDDITGKRVWRNEDIERIKRHAKEIVDACNRI